MEGNRGAGELREAEEPVSLSYFQEMRYANRRFSEVGNAEIFLEKKHFFTKRLPISGV